MEGHVKECQGFSKGTGDCKGYCSLRKRDSSKQDCVTIPLLIVWHAHRHIHAYITTHFYMHKRTHTHFHMQEHTYTCACSHRHTHTRTNTHTRLSVLFSIDCQFACNKVVVSRCSGVHCSVYKLQLQLAADSFNCVLEAVLCVVWHNRGQRMTGETCFCTSRYSCETPLLGEVQERLYKKGVAQSTFLPCTSVPVHSKLSPQH